MHDLTLTLKLLGTGTCVPTPERYSSAYALSYRDRLILFDFGTGTLRRLLDAGLDYREIDIICLTHFHPDHVSDLAAFFLASKYTPGFIRTKPLTLIGPKGLGKFLRQLSDLYGKWLRNPDFPLVIHELRDDSLTIDSLTFTAKPMVHSENSIGIRLETPEQKSITYSGDTGYCQEIIDLARETDLLLIECSFPGEQKMEGHLTPSEVGRIAHAAQANKVVLTHLYPVFKNHNPVEQVKEIFNGETIAGKDLLKFYV